MYFFLVFACNMWCIVTRYLCIIARNLCVVARYVCIVAKYLCIVSRYFCGICSLFFVSLSVCCPEICVLSRDTVCRYIVSNTHPCEYMTGIAPYIAIRESSSYSNTSKLKRRYGSPPDVVRRWNLSVCSGMPAHTTHRYAISVFIKHIG